jgi:hypothetical protein
LVAGADEVDTPQVLSPLLVLEKAPQKARKIEKATIAIIAFLIRV